MTTRVWRSAALVLMACVLDGCVLLLLDEPSGPEPIRETYAFDPADDDTASRHLLAGDTARVTAYVCRSQSRRSGSTRGLGCAPTRVRWRLTPPFEAIGTEDSVETIAYLVRDTVSVAGGRVLASFEGGQFHWRAVYPLRSITLVGDAVRVRVGQRVPVARRAVRLDGSLEARPRFLPPARSSTRSGSSRIARVEDGGRIWPSPWFGAQFESTFVRGVAPGVDSLVVLTARRRLVMPIFVDP